MEQRRFFPEEEAYSQAEAVLAAARDRSITLRKLAPDPCDILMVLSTYPEIWGKLEALGATRERFLELFDNIEKFVPQGLNVVHFMNKLGYSDLNPTGKYSFPTFDSVIQQGVTFANNENAAAFEPRHLFLGLMFSSLPNTAASIVRDMGITDEQIVQTFGKQNKPIT